MEAFWASFQIVCFTLIWNTKHAAKPESFKELWNAKYKGRVGIPAYGWYGMWWLHAVNKVFGGDKDNISPGIQAAADLVKKNDAVVIENVDQGMKAFAREEIVIAPFWNGRALTLQRDGVPVQIAYVPGRSNQAPGLRFPRAPVSRRSSTSSSTIHFDPVLQIEMARRVGYPPSNRLTKLPPDLEHYRVPEADLKNMIALDLRRSTTTNRSTLTAGIQRCSARVGNLGSPLVRAELQVDGLRKTYSPQVTVGPISFEVEKGEFFSLLGPSGSGRQRRSAASLGSKPSPKARSCCAANGSISDERTSQRGIGLVFQNYALFPHLTIFDNVAFGLRLRRWKPQKIKESMRRPSPSRQLARGRLALSRSAFGRPTATYRDRTCASDRTTAADVR